MFTFVAEEETIEIGLSLASTQSLVSVLLFCTHSYKSVKQCVPSRRSNTPRPIRLNRSQVV